MDCRVPGRRPTPGWHRDERLSGIRRRRGVRVGGRDHELRGLPSGGLGHARLALVEDLAAFEAHLGFAIGPIGHLNPSTRPLDYRPSYTSSNADLIARAFADEIARFGYDFDAGPPAVR